MALDKQQPIETIELTNTDGTPFTRQQLINIGLPELYNPIVQFFVDEKTMNEDFNRPWKNVIFVEGECYAQYSEKNPNATPSDFIAAKSSNHFKEHNKKYLHQGGYINNMMGLSSIGASVHSSIAKASVTTHNNVQTTMVKSSAKHIMIGDSVHPRLKSFKDNNINFIASAEESSLIDITTKVNTNAQGETSTSFIKIEFFDEKALEYYKQCVAHSKQCYKERQLINNVVYHELSNVIGKKASVALIKKVNDINPGYSSLDENSQSSYLVVLLHEIKSLEKKSLEKPISNILDKLEKIVGSKKLSTFKQGDLYSAMLKNNITPKLSNNDKRKYSLCYSKHQFDDTKANIINVLKTYYNKPNIGNFFNSFRHHTAAIQKIEERIKNLNEKAYEGNNKEVKQAYRDIIIDEMKKQEQFNGHGEMAKMTGFLVRQLNHEITQLDKEAKATPAAPPKSP
ncbi:MAG: hypothetical protein ACX932_06185 [Gammaproteobacteria bacterium]